MDDELKRHLVVFETNVIAALIGLRHSVDAGFENMHRRFDALDARFDAQDRLLDRQDVVLDKWVRAMEAHIERMDKRDASRPN